MVRLAILVVFVATLVGALMPAVGPGTSDDRPKGGQVAVLELGRGRDAQSQSGNGEVILTRAFDGHFYADVQVNGSTVKFLVDTGATGIALSADDARRAGLNVYGEPQVIGSGASGAVLGHVVRLDRVALGQAVASDAPAVVLDGGERSLLGQSFLSKFGSVEMRGDTMVLR